MASKEDAAPRSAGAPPMGEVSLVGVGPGDPRLITVAGLDALERADVVLYDRLAPIELLGHAPPGAERIDVGKDPDGASFPQREIHRLLVDRARRGRRVVRLKGGDPFVFGRGAEEAAVCRAAGVPCRVIPGVTSAVAAPAAFGVPVTHRGLARSFVVLTGQTAGRSNGEGAADHDWEAIAAVDTVVVLMGLRHLARVTGSLLAAGKAPSTPAIAVASGTTARQRAVRSTLGELARDVAAAGLENPVATLIGPTAALADEGALAGFGARPLAGRRVAITQAATTSGRLRQLLEEDGATVISCPLIEIRYPERSPDLEGELERLTADAGAIDWLVFSSVHAVRAFGRLLLASGRDARALAGVGVAALGPGTARALEGIGLAADLIPPRATAESMVEALAPRVARRSGSTGDGAKRAARVVHPCGNLALPTLAAGLTAVGATVASPVVYETSPADPPAGLVAAARGADALLFCSPSAVERARQVGLADAGDAQGRSRRRPLVGCIGPTTAEAARAAGFEVEVVPAAPGSDGLVRALAERFAAERAA